MTSTSIKLYFLQVVAQAYALTWLLVAPCCFVIPDFLTKLLLLFLSDPETFLTYTVTAAALCYSVYTNCRTRYDTYMAVNRGLFDTILPNPNIYERGRHCTTYSLQINGRTTSPVVFVDNDYNHRIPLSLFRDTVKATGVPGRCSRFTPAIATVTMLVCYAFIYTKIDDTLAASVYRFVISPRAAHVALNVVTIVSAIVYNAVASKLTVAWLHTPAFGCSVDFVLSKYFQAWPTEKTYT